LDNIKVLETGIDVSKVLEQLKKYPEDWGAQKDIEGVSDLVTEHGFPKIEAGVLQLVMGGIQHQGQYVGDTEICIPTPALDHHTEILKILGSHFRTVSRCGFLSLPVGGTVGKHIDIGTYYQSRDRYHLSIQGRYRYFVGDEHYDVDPGTLLWFNNKLPHGTENLADEVRITFVFDVQNPNYI
jgi:hypothetical protein